MERKITALSDIPRAYPHSDQAAHRRAAYFAYLQAHNLPDTLSSRISVRVPLDGDERAALRALMGRGCQQKRKEAIAAFARAVPDVPGWGVYDRVEFVSTHVADMRDWTLTGEYRRISVRAHYCAGQSYPDEMRRLRSLMTGY